MSTAQLTLEKILAYIHLKLLYSSASDYSFAKIILL